MDKWIYALLFWGALGSSQIDTTMSKTEVLSAEAARALFQKEKKPLKVKPEKKVTSASQEMDLGQTPEQAALGAVTINAKADYAEYCEDKGYIEFKQGGRTWRVKAEEVK